MPCEEKKRLVMEYDTVTSAFANVVTKPSGDGALSKDEYDRRVRAVDEARIKSEGVRIALDWHVAMHRCRTPITAQRTQLAPQ